MEEGFIAILKFCQTNEWNFGFIACILFFYLLFKTIPAVYKDFHKIVILNQNQIFQAIQEIKDDMKELKKDMKSDKLQKKVFLDSFQTLISIISTPNKTTGRRKKDE